MDRRMEDLKLMGHCMSTARILRVLCVLLAGVLPGAETVVAGESSVVTTRSGLRRPHPISITEASMYVTKTRAITRLQMFAEDLVLFQELEPNDQDRLLPEDLKRALEDHKKFLLEKFSLRNAKGELLAGQVTDLKPFTIPAEGIPSNEMMMHTAVYEIEHTFTEPPEFLTIQQDIADENFIIPSEMSLHVHQAGTALNFSERLLPGTSTTIRFDWEQTLAENASDQEWDLWFEKQREKTLGITSYSSVYSFIYIEPSEVRHEVLIPLATLATMIRLTHADPAFVEIAEQDVIREEIRQWLRGENPVLINGERVLPEFSRIDFYSLNLSDFAAQAAQQKVSMASGRVGIIMTWKPATDIVRDVSLSWNLFYSAMTKIPAVVVAWRDRMEKFEFSRFNKPEENTLKWSCPTELLPTPIATVAAKPMAAPMLRIPLISLCLLIVACAWVFRTRGTRRWAISMPLVLMAAVSWNVSTLSVPHPWKPLPELSTAESDSAFQSLLQGMYRSLDFGTEDRVYDALAASVEGELLEDLYLQLLESLRVREQGGAVARIREVKSDAGEVLPRTQSTADVEWPGFRYRARWTVAGTVEHWGHIHERQNQFDAAFTIEPRNGTWKITRMDILGQEQKSAKTSLRKF